MPAGWWTDPKVIDEGRQIYSGEGNQLVNCRSCHKDGQPVKRGGGLRDQKHTRLFSDSYWFWRVAEGVPKTTMKSWKSLLSEVQMWQVIAFVHQFSHGANPPNTRITSPERVASLNALTGLTSLRTSQLDLRRSYQEGLLRSPISMCKGERPTRSAVCTPASSLTANALTELS